MIYFFINILKKNFILIILKQIFLLIILIQNFTNILIYILIKLIYYTNNKIGIIINIK